MNLLLRLIKTVLLALWWRKPLHPLATSELVLRVWPNDIDPNLHLTNARYLSIIDLGRLDLLIRTGMGRLMLKQRWSPVLGSMMIRYRRQLSPFQRFRLKSRVMGWDGKWVYLEHVFETMAGEVAAVAIGRGVFLGARGTVPVADILAAAGVPDAISPPIPPAVQAWTEAEQDLTAGARVA